MLVDATRLRDYLEHATFENCGDVFERKYGHYVTETFANCQRFWQLFVVPMTQRIKGYPTALMRDHIRPRKDMPPVLQDIAAAHYSMFFNLVFAHKHLEDRNLYSHEDIYIHLGSACELADRVMGMWYLTRLACTGLQSQVFSEPTWEEVLRKAKNQYANYENPTEYYLKKRRTQPFYVTPSESDLLQEYLAEFLKTPEVWQQYRDVRRKIKTYRNAVVHDVRIGRYKVREEYLVPKLHKIPDYRTWREVMRVKADGELLRAHFREMYEQAAASIRTLEKALDQVWARLTQDFLDEFYCEGRPDLRHTFKIEFRNEPSRADATRTHSGKPLSSLSSPSEEAYRPEPPDTGFASFDVGSATATAGSATSRSHDSEDPSNPTYGAKLQKSKDEED